MSPSFARVSVIGEADGTNPLSVWAARRAFDMAKSQGDTLVRIISTTAANARNTPRMWSHIGPSMASLRRIDILA